MGDCMPIEQQKYIDEIKKDVLERTNATDAEAWDFAFRCWQLDYVKQPKDAEWIRESIETIAKHYGYGNQSRQCIEEMAELIQAINHLKRFNELEYSHHELRSKVFEEMADVEIMLDQMKYLLNCHAEVDVFKVHKLKRQLQRITAKDGEASV